MKRYHQELSRTKRTHAQHLRWVHNWPAQKVNCGCEFQVGRFRKRKAQGCGKSRCLVCHYEKVLNIASIKDRLRAQKLVDSLNDYLDSANEK